MIHRAAYLRIVGGVGNVHDVASRLYFLDNHFPPALLGAALNWLIKNGICGDRFKTWFENDCAGSNLEMHRYLIARVQGDTTLGAVVAGKNFR